MNESMENTTTDLNNMEKTVQLSEVFITDNKVLIDTHLDNTKGEFYFICGLCRKWFATKSSLVIHITEHFVDFSSCEACGELFTRAQDYADHWLQHIGCTCLVCDETFFHQDNLIEHTLQHKLVCMICKKRHECENDLKKHYSEHKGVTNHFCNLCNSYYSSEKSLKFHNMNQHKSKPKSYECEICHETFTQHGSRKRHYLVIHENVKPYVCDLCGKAYTMKNSLITHMANHAGVKPWSCLICGKSFADKRNFKRHGGDHVTKKSLPCNVCGKIFTSEKKLEFHLNMHTSKGLYRCHICPRAFNYHSHLKRHLMAHNDDRPLRCEICKKGFIERHVLLRHMKGKHEYDEEQAEQILRRMKFGTSEKIYSDWCQL